MSSFKDNHEFADSDAGARDGEADQSETNVTGSEETPLAASPAASAVIEEPTEEPEPGDIQPEGAPKREDMFFESRLVEAEKLKAEGTELFKEKKICEALAKYEDGLYYAKFSDLQFSYELMEHHKQQVLAVKIPIQLNMAACCLKLERWNDALTHAGGVLKHDKANMKALYRRGHARMMLGDLDEAKEDLTTVMEMEPANADVRKLLVQLRELQKMDRERQKQVWGGKLKLAEPTPVPAPEGDSNNDKESTEGRTASPGIVSRSWNGLKNMLGVGGLF
mmetsp:Transcript_9414/g.21498  ORF Transcript_9414/g.21498 Transcript_9414/m.21498 type:complete len:279 (+) Transcript_9414:25-861(+)|eukprot:CAMPEP_0114542640 /NCGR_PEP_ID=MMETSP0114-20121206/1938_1 /TAXON_ID=31324 /ORGANISM="Goniomonas sp, Strain m" /LENGTH=278 /DNA_ID=CAMNT_0001726941 /DNA_START=22 /DNA_END=858 /DNA_ORIENTATION=+